MQSTFKKRASLRKPGKGKKAARSDNKPFELERLIERAKKLEAQATMTELEKRYALGVIVKNIHEKYQKTGIKLASAKLGKSDKALYELERLPEAWPNATKFRKMVAETNKNGLPLELTHYTALTYAHPKDRKRLRERALAEAIGAKEFRRLVHNGDDDETTEGTEPPPATPPTAATKLCEMLAATDEYHGCIFKGRPFIEGGNPDTVEPERRQLIVAFDDKLEGLEAEVRGLRAILKVYRTEPRAAPKTEPVAEPVAPTAEPTAEPMAAE